jgi:hypothetical protein
MVASIERNAARVQLATRICIARVSQLTQLRITLFVDPLFLHDVFRSIFAVHPSIHAQSYIIIEVYSGGPYLVSAASQYGKKFSEQLEDHIAHADARV